MRAVRLALIGLLTAGNLTVGVGLADAQTLTSVTPARVANDGVKTLTITGSGFYPSGQEKVTLHPSQAGSAQPDLQGKVLDNSARCVHNSPLGPPPNDDCGGTLAFTVDTTNALPGGYDLIEKQTDDVSMAVSTKTLPAAVAIFSQPTLASTNPVAPSVRGQGAISTIQVTGTGYADGLTADFGPGTTVRSVTVNSPTSADVSLAVAPDAALGTRTVQLTSADGATASRADAFTVAAAPVVTDLTPATGKRSDVVHAVLTGSGFVAGGDFAIIVAGVTVTNPVVSADGKSVSADLTVASNAASGPRSLFLINADGGRASKLNAFSVVAPPTAVTGVTAVPGDAYARVSWTPPADPGSSPVTGYTVAASDSSVAPVDVAGTATSATVPGLANGSSYTFTVTPRNDVGAGPPATSAAVTPKYQTALTSLFSRSISTAGQDVVASGRLTHRAGGAAVGGATIRLTFRPQVGSAFVRNVTTDANGVWRSVLHSTYSTSLVAAFASRSNEAAVQALTAYLGVATRVVVASPTSGAVSAASTPLAVAGSVSPNKAGRVLALYYGSTLLGRSTVLSNGTYRITARLAAGNYRLVVRIAATPGNLAGASPAFIVSRR